MRPRPIFAFPTVLCSALLASSALAQNVELSDVGDIEELCAWSAPVETAFPSLNDGALAPREAPADVAATDPEPLPERIPAPPVELPPDILLEVPTDPSGDDPVLVALRARDYSRARGAALLTAYEVVVPASEFPVWTWHPEPGSLDALAAADVEIHGGAYALVATDPDPLSFSMDQTDADAVLAARGMGSLYVRLRFVLAGREDPWRPICRFDDDVTRIDVHLVSAELEESWSPAPSARAVTVAYEAEQVHEAVQRSGLTSDGREPRVEVTSIEIEGEECSAAEAEILQAYIESMLTDCYVTGLDRNPGLRGALVVAFGLDPTGRVVDPGVQIDVLDDARVRDCVLASIGRLDVERSSGASELAVRTSMRFVRDD